ncbi:MULTISPECIES: LytR C-terminal domain-containing protein [unclassified Brevibacterium]|uniref:LytR C-terminal domain-containing protein n=1 Tax=unclassified Brevibacterium TaxID=2614124 RepID=UPI0010F55F03|nr:MULTISPECIES: LytR C-terminal domain-containing protein [unclassified Brevibacterium]MCM1011469.1 LytR C-terminal domain-containing protein [Brevibacterium sp. XM4083]
MADDYDDIEPGRRSGAHRQEAAASSNVGAIVLVIVLALVAVLLVVAAINIITSSMRNPESNVAEPAPETSAPATPTPSESEVSVADSSLTVDVLNGSGVSGAAKDFSTAVEEEGWTVGQVGNYSTSRSDSVVYYSDDANEAQAKLVADALGIEATERSSDFTADLTVLICSDIAQRGPASSGGESAGTEESGAQGGGTTGSDGAGTTAGDSTDGSLGEG